MLPAEGLHEKDMETLLRKLGRYIGLQTFKHVTLSIALL